MEPKIQIGDYVLSEGQAMAVRVAVTNFHSMTKDEEFRKELGEELADAYHARLGEALIVMLRDSKRTS
jgi:hypothetical protein